MPEVTVIVPVYNIEKYLERCLRSILDQDFSDFECILADDGSPDGCPQMCDEWARKDPRFTVIHQRNAGTAQARQAGINKALGAFLFFVDGDDWIEPGALTSLLAVQKETGADLVLAGSREAHPGYHRDYTFPEIDKTEETLVYFFFNNCKVMWAKLYRRTLFGNIFTPETRNGEDLIVNVQIFNKISPDKIATADSVVYNYDRTSGGISLKDPHNFKHFTESEAVQAKLWVENYLEENNGSDKAKSAFYFYFISACLNDYIRKNKKVTKGEIKTIYERYYRLCLYKKRFKKSMRILFPLSYYCFPLGRVVVKILNLLGFLKRV
jgi:glycosyltransferase involved in cell wall biosynthesis